MPNALTATGLTLATRDELIAIQTARFQSIYGADIVLTSDSPDGQMLNLWVQDILDMQDLVGAVFSSFDPDQAYGTSLDQRCAINGVQRQGGTYTITPVTIVVGAACNLYGLDQKQVGDPLLYTVADSAGNQWYLQTTQAGLTPGTYTPSFRAASTGAVPTTTNTITTPVTIVPGVTSVNNPTTYTTLGTNEESDGLLRIRRQKSVALPSQGFAQAIKAALENVTGVTSANVYENDTSATNSDGVPANTFWCVVSGSGAAADIANAIYTKRSGGSGMWGAQSYTITQADGTTFPVFWDVVTVTNLFISFTVSPIDGVTPSLIASIRSGLPTTYTPGVNQKVDINTLATLVQKIDPNTLVTNAGFSSGYTQVMTLSQVPTSGTFVLDYNGASSAAINWNDSAATIQTTLRAVAGLSLVNVTGSLSSQTLTLDLSGVGGPQGLVTATSNTLTGASGAITLAFSEGYAATLAAPTKKHQYAVASANIIILPMQLTAPATSVAHGNTLQFTAAGGYGTLVFTVSTNNSGGSINNTSGLYTAGTTPNVTDTIKVTDAFGNTATATVSVT